ncbi:MAG TPA: cupin domain-containing protein [Thermoanaerobaculia bacterium]|nr:cupin domain-containing protein [Thermoanaerobaculia bacterium]
MLPIFVLAAAIAFAPEAVVWKDGPPSLPPGSQIAVLEGNPREEGMFTMRVRVPKGATLAPHWHPRDERVTILSGAVELGFGATADRAKVTRYEAGSFYVNPPRMMHYLFFPEETVMQMTGVGPWEIHASDVSAPAEAATGTIAVRSITPAAGAAVDGTTKIRAVVDYDIRGFRPASFYVSVQFESTTPNRTFTSHRTQPGDLPGPPRPHVLASAKGSETITYDLGNVWNDANLQKPVRLRFFLHEVEDPATSRVVASSDWVEYR